MLGVFSRRAFAASSGPKPSKPNHHIHNRILKCKTINELEKLVAKPPTGTEFTSTNCATVFSRLGKLVMQTGPIPNPQAIRTNLYQLCKGQSFTPREISTICHGLAQSRLDTSIPQFVQFDDKLNLADFSAQDLTMMVWGFAKLNQGNNALLLNIQNQVLARDLRPWTALQLVQMCWSVAGMVNPERGNDPMPYLPMFQKIGSEIETGRPMLDSFTEQDLSSLLGSFAKMGFKHQTLFYRVAQDIVDNRSLNTFTAQGISTILWSFAYLGLKHDALLEKVSDHLQHTRVARDVENLAISQILWSFVCAEKQDPALFAYLLNPIIKSKNPRSVPSLRLQTRMLHSVGKQTNSGAPSPNNFEFMFAEYVAKHLTTALDQKLPHQLTNHDMATLMWSFAAARYHDSVLFDKLASSIDLAQVDSQDVSNVMWAMASNSHRTSKEFSLKVAEEINKHGFEGFSCQAVCNLCWSFATLNLLNEPAVQAVYQLSLPETFEIEYFTEHATQLQLARSKWQRANPSNSRLLDALCAGGWIEPLLKKAKEERQRFSATEKNTV